MKALLFLFALLFTVFAATQKRDDKSVQCTLCGLAFNELEGLLNENVTDNEIEDFLNQNVCPALGLFEIACQDLVEQLPRIVLYLEQGATPSDICVGLSLCDSPWGNRPDNFPIQSFVINLDLDPSQRWLEIGSIPVYQQNTHEVLNAILSRAPPNIANAAESIGEEIQLKMGEPFTSEIRGLAQALNISEGLLALMNIAYEASDACTAIIAQTVDGKILHGRNLDFGFAMGFTDVLRNITVRLDFQRGGKTVFHGITYVGYIGLLTAGKPKAFSINVNTRFLQGGVWDIFNSIVEAVTVNNASINSFLIRQIMESSITDFNTALDIFSNHPLIADVYFNLAGVTEGQGAIISRDRNDAANVRMLDANNWFLVQTNYDWDSQPPWFDNRRTPAVEGMTNLGQAALSLDGIHDVLSIKPVLNKETTYTALINNGDDTFSVVGRYCDDPCPI